MHLLRARGHPAIQEDFAAALAAHPNPHIALVHEPDISSFPFQHAAPVPSVLVWMWAETRRRSEACGDARVAPSGATFRLFCWL